MSIQAIIWEQIFTVELVNSLAIWWFSEEPGVVYNHKLKEKGHQQQMKTQKQ